MKRRHVALALAIIGGCIEGGANNGGKKAGNQDGGVLLAIGDIAIDPHGRYFLSRSDGQLVVGDLDTQAMEILTDLPGPDILGFWAHSADSGFYLVSWTPPPTGSTSDGVERVLSYDLVKRRIVWQRELARQDARVDVSPDGTRLLLSDFDDLVALDPGTGETLFSITPPSYVQDIDFTPDASRVVITGATERDADRAPTTQISAYGTTRGDEQCRVTVPNCSSELVLEPSGERAFLAPTTCGRDPVSVIDLKPDGCTFHGNLPGFGPVALSPDGGAVVAFLDRDAVDPEAPPVPDVVKASPDRYHLMFIDTETLEYETSPLGAELPRYTFTPDGRSLLVDNDAAELTQLVILDVDARTARVATGPSIDLDLYALTPDASRAFVVDAGLYELDLREARVTSIALDFVPVTLNMTPDGKRLLLKSGIDSKVHIYSITEGTLAGEISPTR